MGTLFKAKELLRRAAAQDDNYYRNLTYFFELQVPAHLHAFGGNSFVFPILLPTGYTMSEPFSIEKTYSQGGGLVVEENGIIERMITIKGHTGFRPRVVKGNYANALLTVPPEKRSYDRRLPVVQVTNELSGQRHFQYLQDVIIRTYADLKHDPATSDGTKLFFHDPKGQEHWEVKPEKFELNREASGIGRVGYPFDIQLLAVGPAAATLADFSEDKSILQAIGDVLRMIQSGLDMVSGAFNDLTALVADLAGVIRGLDNILGSVTTIIDAAQNFVAGATNLLELPRTLITATIDSLEAALQSYADLEEASRVITAGAAQGGADFQTVPPSVLNKLNILGDGLERIATHGSAFETPAQKALRTIKDSQEVLTATSAGELTSARAAAPAASFEEVDALGTALTAGEVETAEGDLGVGREVAQFTGSRAITVEQGDTLVNLAARHLGDARLWQHIAILNGLQPPFANDLASAPVLSLDESPLSGSVGIGDSILIPNFSRPPSRQAVLTVLGVDADRSIEEHLLGTDFKLVPVGGSNTSPLFGWAVDVEGGSLDAKHISGVDNLGQGLTERVRIEEGSDILFKTVGIKRVVGVNNAGVDLEMVRFRLIQSLQQDARVGTVRSVEFDDAQADALGTEITVDVRGLSEGATINTVL